MRYACVCHCGFTGGGVVARDEDVLSVSRAMFCIYGVQGGPNAKG